jgi:ribose/xylose/arabinose/galactoside ABC-type transport system permease subunit
MRARSIAMSIRQLLIDFSITFAVALVVAVVGSLIFHGAGTIDWETAFRFALIFGITFGIVLPWTRARESKAAEK